MTTVGSRAIAVTGETVSAISDKFAEQRAGADGVIRAAGRRALLDRERAGLHDIAAVGELAGVEQHRAARQLARLGADGEHAQGLLAERGQRRHLLEEGDVVVERHD